MKSLLFLKVKTFLHANSTDLIKEVVSLGNEIIDMVQTFCY